MIWYTVEPHLIRRTKTTINTSNRWDLIEGIFLHRYWKAERAKKEAEVTLILNNCTEQLPAIGLMEQTEEIGLLEIGNLEKLVTGFGPLGRGCAV